MPPSLIDFTRRLLRQPSLTQTIFMAAGCGDWLWVPGCGQWHLSVGGSSWISLGAQAEVQAEVGSLTNLCTRVDWIARTNRPAGSTGGIEKT